MEAIARDPPNLEQQLEARREAQDSCRAVVASLPVELVPEFLEELTLRRQGLAACALVSKSWNKYATPLLYKRIFLRSQQRLISVFETLSQRLDLVPHVQMLDIRSFPFGLPAEKLEELEAKICSVLEAAVSLQDLYWDRAGSLNNRIIPSFAKLTSLRNIEITGDARTWSAHLLFKNLPIDLKSFSVLLPEKAFISALEQLPNSCPSLESFNVLMQHSTHLKDEHLLQLASHMHSLTRLSLAGCRSITHEGVISLLKASKSGLQELALEGLNIHPDHLASFPPYLSKLRALSLTLPRASVASAKSFVVSVNSLLWQLPQLQDLTIYASSWNPPEQDTSPETTEEEEGVQALAIGAVNQPGAPQVLAEQQPSAAELDASLYLPSASTNERTTTAVETFAQASQGRLRRFRLHGIKIKPVQLQTLCRTCPKLERLVVHLETIQNVTHLANCLKLCSRLREVHILVDSACNTPLGATELEEIAKACGHLSQIGARNRVWEVDRVPWTRSSGKLPGPNTPVSLQGSEGAVEADDAKELVLRPWDFSAISHISQIPEVFLVSKA